MTDESTAQVFALNGREYVTQADAAKRRGVSVQTVKNYVKKGDLPTLRIGNVVLIELTELDAYQAPTAGRPRVKLPPEVAANRAKVRGVVLSRAYNRASRELAKMHPADWETLRAKHMKLAYEETGPLPGDDLLAEATDG